MSNTVGSTTTDYYNSTASSGKVLEESVGGVYTTRYVWSPAYVNQMIDRDTDTSGTGLTATGTSYTRLYALSDANYDTVALINTSGTVVERDSFDPFGTATYLTGSFGARCASSYGWVYLFQGGRLDGITGDNHFGARNEDPATGAWTREDPTGFGGNNDDFYSFEGNSTLTLVDPSGLLDDKPTKPSAVDVACELTVVSRRLVDEVNQMSKLELGVDIVVPKNETRNYYAHGPCYHYAAKMSKWLDDNAAKNGWSDLRHTTQMYHVYKNPNANGYIIVQVSYKDSDGSNLNLWLDAGAPASYCGNLGDLNGIVDKNDVNKLIKERFMKKAD